MPTSKVRPKTPMKNKTKMWRKTPKQYNPETCRVERYGRRLRNAMQGMNHPGFLLPVHVGMFNSAGIPMPKLAEALDRQSATIDTVENVEADSAVSDVEILNEGNSSASFA